MWHIEEINRQSKCYNEESAFQLLGDVGTFAASCNRHNVKMFREGGDAIKPLGGIINKLSIITGTAPRAIINHFTIDNIAIDGEYRGFTHSVDEKLFFDFGTIAMLAYEEASSALKKVQSLGFSHPLSIDFLQKASKALNKVEQTYQKVEQLKPMSFYGEIMPYLSAHKIRSKSVRGFSAGDFGSANEVDLQLGVCVLEDPFYAGICLEKMPYMRRRGQDSLREVCGFNNILDQFLLHSNMSESPWYKDAGKAFLGVIEANRSVGKRHHDVIIEKYLTKAIPDDENQNEARAHLSQMVKFLERIRDLRAAEIDNIPYSKAKKVRELSEILGQ
jgi:hypothetical protein